VQPRPAPLDVAVAYAGRGWAVFPCHAPADGPGQCSCWRADCSSPAKHPRVPGGLKSATMDVATIRRWWQRWPAANVAIRTGAISGLVVVDVDPDHGGERSFEALLKEHAPLPDGLVVQTGSGGRHYYFAHPGGLVRNDTGRRLGAGLDIRGDGGYVIAPPSRHISGANYRRTSRSRELPSPPDWLLSLVREPPRPPIAATPLRLPPSTSTSAWARPALERELGNLAAASVGSRNCSLNRAAFCLGQIVGAGVLDRPSVEALLLEQARRIGLGESEARATIASGLTAGTQQPRGPAPKAIDLRTIVLRPPDGRLRPGVNEPAMDQSGPDVAFPS
jgi:hypothetical protein